MKGRGGTAGTPSRRGPGGAHGWESLDGVVSETTMRAFMPFVVVSSAKGRSFGDLLGEKQGGIRFWHNEKQCLIIIHFSHRRSGVLLIMHQQTNWMDLPSTYRCQESTKEWGGE